MCWNRDPNFGDRLGPWLFERVTGKRPVYTKPRADSPYYVTIGSIFGETRPPAIVWGTGIISARHNGAPNADYRAVRGPLTRNRIIELGGKCPAIFGDPALLLPRFHTPSTTKQFELGIIPHYVDREIANREWAGRRRIIVIDVTNSVTDVVDQIASCDAIASSSLHGLIIADAYGIPNRWVKWSDRLVGDGTKFMDHRQATGRTAEQPLIMNTRHYSLYQLQEEMLSPRISTDLDKLWAVCPFK